MAKNDNIFIIPISRNYNVIAAIVMMVSGLSMLQQCHGQWWFDPATAPSSSSSIDNFTRDGPPDWQDFIPTNIPAGPPLPAISTTPTTTNTFLFVTTVSSYCLMDPLTFYDSVQAAINAIPENNTNSVTIQIQPGTYREKVSIPSTKPYITLLGAGKDTTIITYNDTNNSTGSTLKSATFTVLAANFTARNITFQNSAPHAFAGEIGAQAVSILIGGDMAAFYGCGFVSSQDTICDEAGRHYFRDCYIEGNIDIIWGNGQSLYEYCEIQSTAGNGTGCITAQSRNSDSQRTGFAFVGGSITGTGENMLGRAYGSHSRVLFINTYMDDIILPHGWSDWVPTANSATRTRHYYYGEHGNTGPGADLTNRVSWMINITDAEAANFSSLSFIDGSSWLTSVT